MFGVIGVLWLIVLVRGELKDVWGYIEDGSFDMEDVVVDVVGELKVVEKKDGEVEKKVGEVDKKEGKESGDKKDDLESYDVFYFFIFVLWIVLKVIKVI